MPTGHRGCFSKNASSRLRRSWRRNEKTTSLTNTVDWKNALREVNTDRNKLGQGWLLSLKRQHPDDAPTQRREQEPSIPSIELAFAKLKSILCHGSVRTINDYRDTIQRALRRLTLAECCRYLAAAGYDAYDPT